MAVNILHCSFPHPMNTDTAKISSVIANSNPPKPSSSVTTNPKPPEQKLHDPSKTNCPTLPVPLSALPYSAIEDNISHLKQFLQQQFATSVFNCGPPFPEMKTPPVHIHLKPGATPYAWHTPIPIT